MKHLDEASLVQLALGEADAVHGETARAHLLDCVECRERHEALSATGFARTVPGSSGARRAHTLPDRPFNQSGAGPQRGAVLGRYVLLEKLGSGGMGDVFAAFDPHLDRRVALKLLRGTSLSAQEGRTRLLREAQALARLQHPNVIAVHDVGTIDDRVFIAMEFVDGETVADWLRGTHTWQEIVDLFVQAGAGLAAAHAAGLVHRDFKPENVLLGRDNRPRVLDFGLARQSAAPSDGSVAPQPSSEVSDSPLTQRLTRDGAVMGTPGYMAPEQLAGKATDARSDQFSFCVALFEALYGRRPFGGETLKQHASAMASGELPPAPLGSLVPEWVHAVLARGLEAEPSKRWPDMPSLLAALAPKKERSPRRTLMAVALVAFAAVGIGYGVYTKDRLSVCGGQDQPLRDVWNEATRQELKRAFLATRLAFAGDAWASVEKTLDAWALDWAQAAREVCEATRVRHIESNEVMTLRAGCLDDRLQRLRALTTLFGQGDREVVVNAPVAAKYLESPLECVGRAARSQVADDAEIKAEQALRARIADAEALVSAGKYDDASRVLKPALRTQAPERAAAEGWLLLGRIELNLSDEHAAQLAHVAAAEHALKASDDALTAMALSRLYANEGYDTDGSNADVFARLAQAAASRVASDWRVEVELARNEGLVAIRRRRFAPALSTLERALALQREHLGREHPDVASTLNNIGTVLTRLHRFDEAIASYRQSLAIHQAVEGKNHPNTAASAHNLGVTYRLLGRYAEAKPLFEQALTARLQALGPTHQETQASQVALTRVAISLGEFDAAAALVGDLRIEKEGASARERVPLLELEGELALATHSWKEAQFVASQLLTIGRERGPNDPIASQGLVLQGRALTGAGVWADARHALVEVLAIETRRDEKHREERLLIDVTEALGHLEMAQNRCAEALPSLRKALELREAVAVPSRGLAMLLLDLARCQLETGHRLDAAESAERAVSLFEPMQTSVDLTWARLIALATSETGRSEMAGLLEELPADEQTLARAWLAKQGWSLDAGAHLTTAPE